MERAEFVPQKKWGSAKNKSKDEIPRGKGLVEGYVQLRTK